MEKDQEIKRAVEHELRWDSGIDHPDITVASEDGVVILSGCVHACTQKMEAERAALRVEGVRRVINNISVKVDQIKTDQEIQNALTKLLKWNADVSNTQVSITVNGGWVTLEGEVEHEYQYNKAEFLAEDLSGVTGVTNNIRVLVPVTKNRAA